MPLMNICVLRSEMPAVDHPCPFGAGLYRAMCHLGLSGSLHPCLAEVNTNSSGRCKGCSTHHVCSSCLTCWLPSFSLELSQCCHCRWHLLALGTCRHTAVMHAAEVANPHRLQCQIGPCLYTSLTCTCLPVSHSEPRLLHDFMDDRMLLLCRSMWKVQ